MSQLCSSLGYVDYGTVLPSQPAVPTRNCLLQEELWCIIHVLPELYEVPLGSRMQVRKASQSGESWVTEGRDSSTEFQVTKRTRDG